MSERKERQYEVKEGEKSPFLPSKTHKDNVSMGSNDISGNRSQKKSEEEPRGPYGSIWGLKHLNWLHLHLTLGYDWEELFSPESEIPQASRIASHLQHSLGAEWKWICDNKHENSLSIYALFQALIDERKATEDWRTATHTSTDFSSPPSSRGQSSRDSTSPQQNRQGMLSRQERETTPTPLNAGPEILSSTPGHVRNKRSHGSTPSPQRQPGQIFTSEEEQSPEVDNHPTFREITQDDQLRRLVEEEEVEEREAQDHVLEDKEDEAGAASAWPPEDASKGTSEKDVDLVGAGFLHVVQDAMKSTHDDDDAKNIKFAIRETEETEMHIDGVLITAKPDRSLECTFGKAGQTKTIEVALEFKKRNHMRPPSRILGQECAEMLGMVSMEKKFLERVANKAKKPMKSNQTYTSYLISWHGLMAYVSRLDTTQEYLEQLDQGSSRLQDMDPLRIRRSRLLNLTRTQDRLDLAMIAARVAVEQLSQYDRNRKSGLMDRLRR